MNNKQIVRKQIVRLRDLVNVLMVNKLYKVLDKSVDDCHGCPFLSISSKMSALDDTIVCQLRGNLTLDSDYTACDKTFFLKELMERL